MMAYSWGAERREAIRTGRALVALATLAGVAYVGALVQWWLA